MGYIERNRRKLEEIYDKYKDDVYRVSLYFTRDSVAAKEVAQKVFFNFYQHIDQIEVEAVRGYLVRAARNTSLNYIRDKKREDLQDSWDTLGEESATVISVEEVFFRSVQKQQESLFVNSILEGLLQENEDWYHAVNMIYCLGKPHDVVADEMDLTKDALYSLLYRAKKWIRKRYESEYEDLKKRS